MGVDVMRDQTLKRRDLNSSPTLGCVGKTDSKPNPSGLDGEGDSRLGQRGCVCCVYAIERSVNMGWVSV